MCRARFHGSLFPAATVFSCVSPKATLILARALVVTGPPGLWHTAQAEETTRGSRQCERCDVSLGLSAFRSLLSVFTLARASGRRRQIGMRAACQEAAGSHTALRTTLLLNSEEVPPHTKLHWSYFIKKSWLWIALSILKTFLRNARHQTKASIQ